MDKRIRNTIKALTQLRFSELASYGVYQFQKTLGLFRFSTPMKSRNKDLGSDRFIPADFLLLPPEVTNHLTEEHKQSVIQKAGRIISGQIQVFGTQERDLNLSPGNASTHWSEIRRADHPDKDFDIKDIWEPARFMWAVTLTQAFSLTGENVYAEFFFNKVKEFNQNNPYNKGPNWESAQEVGLRLIALVICASAFASQYRSTSPDMLGLLRLIADHADRIPPTLSYAIAQNNNHLLSESVALYTAGVFLPAHPRAARWKKLGMKWFQKGLSRQITDDGQYVQYSNNYHRMMLMLALWMNRMHNLTGEHLTQESIKKLKIATTWLFNELDLESGRVPNYGHNDGSFILPFSTCPFEDYRPAIQASAIAFHGREFLPPGPWDDLAQWLGLGKPTSKIVNPMILKMYHNCALETSDPGVS